MEEGDKEPKKKFKSYPIGNFHVDIAEVQKTEGKLYLFVTIDRTSKFAFVELYAKAGKMNAAQFLRKLIATVPHTILTNNGIQFTNQERHKYAFHHIFDRVCDENNIEHRPTKVMHLRTNGQLDRKKQTNKEAIVNRFHYDDHAQLKKLLAECIDAYNFERTPKMLKGLIPYEYICKQWTSGQDRFIINPIHQMPELITYSTQNARCDGKIAAQNSGWLYGRHRIRVGRGVN